MHIKCKITIICRVSHPQIVADIYESQGISFVDAYGTFITNELLPLVEKTVTDKKVTIETSLHGRIALIPI